MYRAVEHNGFVEIVLLGPKLREEEVEALVGAADALGWHRVLLDCTGVQFLTSLGLGCLIQLDRRLRPRGGRLRLCGLNPDLRELFEITRIDRVMQLCDDRDSALAMAW